MHRDNVPAARRLRKQLTPTEEILWDVLRDRRLLGLKFRRQHPIGPFVVDFYCHDCSLAIEVDGGVHDDPVQRARDRDRQAILEELGVEFLRLRASDLEGESREWLRTLKSTIQSALVRSARTVRHETASAGGTP